MKKIPKAIHQLYLAIIGSIAFWPTLISIGFFLLAIAMVHFEGTPFSVSLEKQIPLFKNVKEDVDNARLIINILASGTISLTVFSFSMVMIVLSQATSNLSPRVVPGLISNKTHQVVLGVYTGTIIYAFFLMLSFKSGGSSQAAIPVLGILIGLFWGILCLGLFVFFIHSISRSIQVDNIIKRIYQKAIKAIEQQGEIDIDDNTATIENNEQNWYVFQSIESGYLRRIQKEALLEFATQQEVIVEVLIPIGGFMVAGYPFLKFSRDLSQVQDLAKNVIACFIFSLDEMIMDDYEYNMNQISEIATKALSPGINDPGTAVNALDFMTLLLARRLQAKESCYLVDKNNNVRVILKQSSLDTLLFRYLAPIRTYGKDDVKVMYKLLESLKTLVYLHKSNGKYLPDLLNHAQAVRNDADKSILNPKDRLTINQMLEQLAACIPEENLKDKVKLLPVDKKEN